MANVGAKRMQNEANVIKIGEISLEIKSLVDLHNHWPEISNRLRQAIEGGEIEDEDLCKIVEWLIILGDKTLFRSN